MDDSKGTLNEQVMESLKGAGCCDFRFSIEQLGLISDVQVANDGRVSVRVLPCCVFGMTRLVTSVKESLAAIEGVGKVDVEVAWDQLGERGLARPMVSAPLQMNLESQAREHGLKPWGAPSQG